MYIIPKIIVFTLVRKRFFVFNRDYEKDDNKFYSFGGNAFSLEQIKEFVNSENENKTKKYDLKKQEIASSLNSLNRFDESKLIYEYIDKNEKLIFSLFFKCIIDNKIFCSGNSVKKFLQPNF